ncbi:MAG TPA: hypothetical protein VJM47_04765 [Nitrosospira sp.]|nr:hypothetical protein [Nitrosospira sp.]
MESANKYKYHAYSTVPLPDTDNAAVGKLGIGCPVVPLLYGTQGA